MTGGAVAGFADRPAQIGKVYLGNNCRKVHVSLLSCIHLMSELPCLLQFAARVLGEVFSQHHRVRRAAAPLSTRLAPKNPPLPPGRPPVYSCPFFLFHISPLYMWRSPLAKIADLFT